jgi:hypothetical protein
MTSPFRVAGCIATETYAGLRFRDAPQKYGFKYQGSIEGAKMSRSLKNT